MPSNSPENPVRSDLSTEETWNTPRSARECSREVFPQTEDLSDVTGTYTYREFDMETNSEQTKKSPTNHRSSKYNLRHNPKPKSNDVYSH